MQHYQFRIAPAIACVFALAQCFFGGDSVCAQNTERPNIVVVCVDDMGWSDIGCYGGEISTPHVDSLTAAGVCFTQICNTGRCGPTRGSAG